MDAHTAYQSGWVSVHPEYMRRYNEVLTLRATLNEYAGRIERLENAIRESLKSSLPNDARFELLSVLHDAP